MNDLYAALGEFTPGAKWNGGSYIDANTGVRAKIIHWFIWILRT